MMNLDIFRTPKQLPFLYYSGKDVEYIDTDSGETKTIKNQLSLELGDKPIIEQPSLDDLWTLVDLGRFDNHEMGKLIAINKLCNEVARRTRRACANIVFVPNDTEKLVVDTHNKKYNMTAKVIVDETLKPNELRATYWEVRFKRERTSREHIYDITTTNEAMAVDGGIQLSPDGFSCIRRENGCTNLYKDYFVRGFCNVNA